MTLMPDMFEARERAFEAAYFHKRDAELLAKIRSGLAEMEDKNKLAHVSGILDEKVLLDLLHAGVTGESLLAMRFVPMVAVAWADPAIDPAERAEVLKAAENEHIVAGSPAHQLLCNWLEHRPDEAVIVAWKKYIHELAHIMPPESLEQLRSRTESLCQRVAKATGGILGIGSISQAEQETIDDFMASWERS
jgi:hypothetical protein